MTDNLKKSIEELSNEGWNDTFQSFANFKIYKKDNELMLYNSREQSIYHQFVPKEITKN